MGVDGQPRQHQAGGGQLKPADKEDRLKTKRYVVAITGASGVIYGLRLVEALAASPEREVHLIVSPAGARVMAEELGIKPKLSPFKAASLFRVDAAQAGRIKLHSFGDIGAGPASGTFRAAAMIVCPASVKTIGAIAAGLADNLVTRAADVSRTEGRPLVVVPRETPFSTIHLRNLLAIAEAGGIVLPASPAFYHKPKDIEGLVGYVVQKIFDRLGIDYPGGIRWGEE